MSLALRILLSAVTLVIVLGGTVVFVFFGGWKIMSHRFEDTTSETVAISEVRVEGGGAASVEVRPGTTSHVNIQRNVHYLGDKPGVSHRIEGTVLYVDTAPRRFCIVSYIVTIPRGAKVFGELGSGSWRLTGVSTVNVKTSIGAIVVNDASGDVDVETSIGSIKIKKVDGLVRAVTTAGGIDITGVKTLAEVRTTTGKISLEVQDIQDNFEISSTVGGITIFLSPGINAELEVSTSSGSITYDRDLFFTLTESTNKKLSGQIGEGGRGSLNVKSSTGSISLKKLGSSSY